MGRNHETESSGSSNEDQAPPKKIRKQTELKYRKAWEELAEFKQWLCQDKTCKNKASRAYCKLCNASLIPKKSELQKHIKMQKHQKFVKIAADTQQLKISNFASTSMERKIKTAEIKLCLFAVNQNMPMSTFDRMPDALRSIFIDSDIAKGINLGRTKATAIVKNVTGKFGFENLVSILKAQNFSIIIDESTSIDSKKSLVVIVRYIDAYNHVKEDFLSLIEVPEATSEIMFDKLINFFNDNQIPYKKNLIGFASDGASVMVGKHRSVSKFFKNLSV